MLALDAQNKADTLHRTGHNLLIGSKPQTTMGPAAKTTIAGKPVGPVGFGLMGRHLTQRL